MQTIGDVELNDGFPGPETDRLISWIQAHRVDHTLVPVGHVVKYDRATDEWVFPTYVRKPGGLVFDHAKQDMAIRRLRRKVLATP